MQKINDFMHKEMTRKEFLTTVGFGVAGIFGLGTLLRLVTGKESPLQQNSTLGYGDGPYGGRKA